MKKSYFTIKSFLVAAISLGYVTTSFGQDFSLKQAQEHALENYYEAANAGLDIRKSQSKVWETTAIGLPQVNASGGYRYAADLEFPIDDAALQQPGSEFLAVFAADNVTQFKVDATQLLFDGSYIVGLQAAKKYVEFSRLTQEQTYTTVKANVASAYYLVLVADENIKVLQGSFKNVKTSITETIALVEQGFVDETELDQLKLMQSDLESNLASAKNSKEVAVKMLKLNMGIDLTAEVKLTDNLASMLEQISIESLAAETFNAGNNADLKVLAAQKELLRLDLKRYKFERLPTLAAYYGYQNTAYQTEFNLGNADWFDQQNLGLNISLPLISSGMQGAKIKQAKLELAKMENTLSYFQNAMSIQYTNALNDLTTKNSNLVNAKKSLEIAQKIYDRTEIKHKEGLSSSFELSQMKNQLLQSQGKYIQSLFDLLNAKAALDKLQNK